MDEARIEVSLCAHNIYSTLRPQNVKSTSISSSVHTTLNIENFFRYLWIIAD